MFYKRREYKKADLHEKREKYLRSVMKKWMRRIVHYSTTCQYTDYTTRNGKENN
jgi:hypothetical protein